MIPGFIVFLGVIMFEKKYMTLPKSDHWNVFVLFLRY